MTEPTLTLEEATALMEKHATEAEAKKKKKDPRTEEVKDLLKEGSKQGRGGLGTNTKRLLDQIDD